jgi:hypothetical protein
VEDARLAYRVRTAEASDEPALRAAIAATLAHPDKQGKRESYRGAAARGDILVLERYDRQERAWHIAGFIECHVRVDDTLTIRDIGTATDEPQAGLVRYLLDQAFGSFRPVSAQLKVRRDAEAWLEILRGIPGFAPDGEEYRRPHYWTIWNWDPQRAREAERQGRQAPGPRRPGPPRPPQPPGQGARAPARPPDRRAGAPARDGRPPAGRRPGPPPRSRPGGDRRGPSRPPRGR